MQKYRSIGVLVMGTFPARDVSPHLTRLNHGTFASLALRLFCSLCLTLDFFNSLKTAYLFLTKHHLIDRIIPYHLL